MIDLSPEELAALSPADLDRLLFDTDRHLAEQRLTEFVRQAWPVLEPARAYLHNWHIDCMAEHLEAVYPRRDLRRLVINVPPGMMKSLLVSVFWPDWCWLHAPSLRFLAVSGSQAVAIRDALKARTLIESNWFQDRWGSRFRLSADQNQKMRYENDHRGYRIGMPMGGRVTGERGDILLIDDPIDAHESNSEAVRENANRILRESLPTRLNDQREGAIVLIMQRLHKQDPTSVMLEWEDVHHLVLPMEWEPPVYVEGTSLRQSDVPQPHDDCPIATDPRTEPGDLLFPDLFPEAVVRDLAVRLTPYGAAGQLQQRPTARGGALFQEEWFQPLPKDLDRSKLRIVQAWDTNRSQKESSDWTVGLTLGVDDLNRMFILHVYREHQTEENLPAVIAEMATIQGASLVWIEDPAFSAKGWADQMKRMILLCLGARMHGRTGVDTVKPQGEKWDRAQAPASWAKNGFLYADRSAPWWQEFVNELIDFPNGAHDDQVDALSLAVRMAIEGRIRSTQVKTRPGDFSGYGRAVPVEVKW